jgi:hypothetical protein
MKLLGRKMKDLSFIRDKANQTPWGYTREEQLNNMIELSLMVNKLKNHR